MFPQVGRLTAHHFALQKVSDFFKTLETLEAVKKKWIQPRWVSTTLLTAASSDTIDPELLRAVGFDSKKALTIVLPDTRTVSELEDLALDSDQEPKATTAVYTQPHPQTLESSQASNKHHLDLMKLSTILPTLTAALALHLPIDDAQVGWLDHFLTNADIQNNLVVSWQSL